jgi:hypothetical protein
MMRNEGASVEVGTVGAKLNARPAKELLRGFLTLCSWVVPVGVIPKTLVRTSGIRARGDVPDIVRVSSFHPIGTLASQDCKRSQNGI